jgi:hypothetical protein
MALHRVFCYRIEHMAVIEVEASSHDIACEVALNLMVDNSPDIHFTAPTDLVEFALKLPIEDIVATAEMPEDAPWPVD